MKVRAIVIGFLLVIGFTAPARADIDQRCISLCVNANQAPSACMGQCTYTTKTYKPEDAGQPLLSAQKNKVFKPVTPGDDQLIAPAATKAKDPEEDYECVTRCQKNGLQDQLCTQACHKAVCPPNKVMCTDELGNKTLPGKPQVRPLGFLTDPDATSVSSQSSR